ncbi:MAG: hypothetical protein KJ600_06480 [Nanoarchaeota archaeon]|nr:hypothetical protein [Nanoarchaeota archaeon]MBU1104171.1 hypothetical protein [Nanoarchaeota archaeon]
MKKEVVVLLLLGFLLFLPIVLAQEQTQIYSGFDRFVDNTKMFFSFGDKKARLALEVKEKEVYSAIENNHNGNEEAMSENLENAWKKLQTVQKKVSLNVAEEVKGSSSEIRNRIAEEENLPDDFEVYILEEEKTELTAELVMEVEGKEGQTLEREVEIVMGEDDGQNRVMEIETRMGEIDEEIKNWVVDKFDKTVETDDGLTWEVATKIVKEDKDDGLTREIKTYVAGDGTDNVVDPGPQGITGNRVDEPRGNDDSSGDTNNIVGGGGGDGDYAEGTTAEGTSVEGSNEVGPAVDSNEGDSGDSASSGDDSGGSEDGGGDDSEGDSGITGEVVRDSDSKGLIKKIFDWLF